MLMSDEEFLRLYKDQYDAALAEAKGYVDDPASLRREVDQQAAQADAARLVAPRPDQFTYRMMNYRGFVRFPERLKNYILAKNEARSEESLALPYIMDIEPVSRCNFRCIMCANPKREGKPKSDLTLDGFKAFMDQNPQFVEVKIQGLGEPLMNRDLFGMIEHAIARDTWVRTTVNGSLLHVNDNHKRLIDSGIGEVQTSFDGATKEVFEHIRAGADFDQIVKNLTALNAYVATKDRDYTRMWVLLQSNNRHQLLDFIPLAARMGFRRMSYSVVITGWGDEDRFSDLKVRPFSDEEEGRILELAKKEGVDVSVWNCTDRFTLDSPANLCCWPFGRAFIGSDLSILPCGLISHLDNVQLGNALEFREAWNSPAYRAFRKKHLEGRIPDFCRECYNLGQA
ncbi:MAG TPA: radical SAM protein [Humidesulfovibrio sp.]|uniref:radical SAM protein n=1 Tax=Humidesulfovibrio sp. TaxID=2910988 RepID=UPI002C11D85E|nr:radical SAM protein [Humidesulfovibrio sp.]HWR03255.1 radical SAM protein [Humidesulfovibrio sp.]